MLELAGDLVGDGRWPFRSGQTDRFRGVAGYAESVRAHVSGPGSLSRGIPLAVRYTVRVWAVAAKPEYLLARIDRIAPAGGPRGSHGFRLALSLAKTRSLLRTQKRSRSGASQTADHVG